MEKMIAFSILIILWALSFIIMNNLPNYIVESSYYAPIILILWAFGFGVSFIKIAVSRR